MHSHYKDEYIRGIKSYKCTRDVYRNKDFKGYEKLLNDFHLMYSSMTDMENQGLRE